MSDMSSVKRTNLVAVVDDDDLLRDALRRLLKASGLGAISFESAEDLLNSGRLSEIACLIADVRMPGISGLELQARLKLSDARSRSFSLRPMAMPRCGFKRCATGQWSS